MTIPPGRKNRDLPIRPLNQKGAETVLSEMLWQAVLRRMDASGRITEALLHRSFPYI